MSWRQKELTKKFKYVKEKLDEETMLPREWVILCGSTKVPNFGNTAKRSSIQSSTARFEKEINQGIHNRLFSFRCQLSLLQYFNTL